MTPSTQPAPSHRLSITFQHRLQRCRPLSDMPLMRIPYTDPLPLPRIIPPTASNTAGAIAALSDFLTAPAKRNDGRNNGQTVLLTGAGISVASGLADYRGTNGTYTLNKTYRPIYFNEFCERHEARKRYWARSFLGWTNLHKARPNSAHLSIGKLGELGRLSSVITQSMLKPAFIPVTVRIQCRKMCEEKRDYHGRSAYM